MDEFWVSFKRKNIKSHIIFENMAIVGIALMIGVFLIAACCGSASGSDQSFHDPSKIQNQQSPHPSRNRNHGGPNWAKLARPIIAGSSRGFSRDRDDDDI